MSTTVFTWTSGETPLAKLEVRHHKCEMMLVVSGDTTGKVRKRMSELNSEGIYLNEETTNPESDVLAQFIISRAHNWNSIWRDFKKILDDLIGIRGTEHQTETI